MLNSFSNNIDTKEPMKRQTSYTKSFHSSLKFPDSFLLTDKIEKPSSKLKMGISELDENIRKLNYEFYNNSIKFKNLKSKLDKIDDELFLNLFRQIDLYVEEVEKLNKKIEQNHNNDYKIIINNLKKQITEKNEKIRYCEKVINEKNCKEDKLLKEIESYKRRIIFYKNKIKIGLLTRNNEIRQLRNLPNNKFVNSSGNLPSVRRNTVSNIYMRENGDEIFSPPKKINKSPSNFAPRLSGVTSPTYKDNNATGIYKKINQIIIEDTNENDCSPYLSSTFNENVRNRKNLTKESLISSNDSQEEFINHRNLYDVDKDKNDLVKEGERDQVMGKLDFLHLLENKNKNNDIKNGGYIKYETENNDINENKRYIHIEEGRNNKTEKFMKKNNTKISLISTKNITPKKINFTDRNGNKNKEINLHDSIHLYKTKNKAALNSKQNSNKTRVSSKSKNNNSNVNNLKLTRNNNIVSSFIPIQNEKSENKFHITTNLSNQFSSRLHKKYAPDVLNQKKILENQANLKLIENSITDIQKLGKNLELSSSMKNLNENAKKGIVKQNVKKISKSNDKDKEISKILNEMNDDYSNNIEMLSRQEEQIKYMLSFLDLNNK